MVIVFLSEKNQIYICPENGTTKTFSLNDPNMLNYLPDDDILYVQSGKYITKQQFADWLNHNEPTTGFSNRKYIHATKNGVIVMDDIKTQRFPEGLHLQGKYHFIPVDEIGQDNLDESTVFRVCFAQGKVEYVDENYVQQNKHKGKKISPSDMAIQSILVPSDMKAASFVSGGGGETDHTQFIVEG